MVVKLWCNVLQLIQSSLNDQHDRKKWRKEPFEEVMLYNITKSTYMQGFKKQLMQQNGTRRCRYRYSAIYDKEQIVVSSHQDECNQCRNIYTDRNRENL